ncbi:unnamed protein product [Rhodiola kirilowii]
MAASLLTYTFATSPMPKTHFNPPLGITRSCNLKFESLKDVCKRGNLSAAVELFSSLFVGRIRVEFSHDEAYAAMTELCASVGALPLGEQIHSHLITSGAVSDSEFLNTKLVMMYGKCGAVDNAEKVFDKMPHRTTFTWNGMIGACISSREYLKALRLYRDMRVCGVSLDAYTFPCVLKGCGALGDSRTGFEIHGLAIKYGCISVGFVVNALVSMYSKCNDLDGARRLFDRMAEREDVVLWNSMISAYSGSGYAAEGIHVFREMQSEGVAANTYTLVAALQACEESSVKSIGQQIHGFVLRSGCHLDVYVANALLAFYARLGDMGQAANIFYNMDRRDHVTWNTMLSGFTQNGLYRDVLSLFQDMVLDDRLIPDQVSLLNIASAAGRLGKLLIGKAVHAYAVKHGFDLDLQVWNTMLDMYSKCSSVAYMSRIYDTMDGKDLITRTTVIAGYAQNNCYTKALEMFKEVQIGAEGIDPLMIGSILLACKGLKSVSQVKQIHTYITRRGISDLMLQNNIVDVYGECGNVDYAVRVFELTKSKDVVTWTSLITCFVNNGLAKEALELFADMIYSGLDPDFVVLVSLLSAVSSFSALKKGKEIHGFLLRKGIDVEGSILNSLVDMYANCGSLVSSGKLFNSFGKNDLTLWTCMINAYGMHGDGRAAINLFERMKNENLIPDHIAFLALLQACSHSGLKDDGKKYFEKMTRIYELEPWPEHYVCLVDLLGRANYLDEAFHYVQTMRIEPTAEIWCSLLNACRIHSNEELGNVAAEKLLLLNPASPGNYVLVSNLYASNLRWKEVDKVRMRMKENDLKKNPGCSWIESNNMIHSFTARDYSHPQTDKIYQKLFEVTKRLEHEGDYVAQTSLVMQNVGEEEKANLLYTHSERLAIAYGLIVTSEGMPIRITKNLRVCRDCHDFCKLVSKLYKRELIIRDAKRFHHFSNGGCSCGDFW